MERGVVTRWAAGCLWFDVVDAVVCGTEEERRSKREQIGRVEKLRIVRGSSVGRGMKAPGRVTSAHRSTAMEKTVKKASNPERSNETTGSLLSVEHTTHLYAGATQLEQQGGFPL